MTIKQPRVNYDDIAHLYDSQPHRDKTVDPQLLAFLTDQPRQADEPPAVLDLGCGTGNQLVANRSRLVDARLVGVDFFHGMLRQARPKADDIAWVQADSAAPPFVNQSFDFISNQYSFHHVQNKPALIKAVYRLLRPGGRFVMTNICPREMKRWLYYRYFPAALAADLHHFWPKEEIVASMKAVGFRQVQLALQPIDYEQDLTHFVESVRRRDTCSQLVTISDEAYQTGLQRLEEELRWVGRPVILEDHICLVTIRGDKS